MGEAKRRKAMDAKEIWDWASDQIQAAEKAAEKHRGDMIRVANEMGKVDAYQKLLIKLVVPAGAIHGRSEAT